MKLPPPGQSTVLVNDGSDVIVRIFGHGSTMCMYAGGVAIDSFNGHLIILKRGTEANVTNIRPMDETMIDIDPYFTIISYTEPDVLGVCVENGVVKQSGEYNCRNNNDDCSAGNTRV